MQGCESQDNGWAYLHALATKKILQAKLSRHWRDNGYSLGQFLAHIRFGILISFHNPLKDLRQ